MDKKRLWANICYILLVLSLFLLTVFYAFDIIYIKSDSFLKFLIILLFVVLILPSVRHIKFFDLIDVIKARKKK